MIVWDLTKKTPLRTFFDPDEEGIQSIDITEEGDKIVTLGKKNGKY